MGLIAKETGNGGVSREPIEAGMQHAVCYGLIDLGTHYDDMYKKTNHKVMIQWEIPDLRIELTRDGETVNVPRIISKRYTISLHEKAGLRKDLESWRGRAFTPDELKGFDLNNLLGVNCNLNIVHQARDGKTYANISSITPLMKTQATVQPESPTTRFCIVDGDEIPNTLSPKVVEYIMASEEWQNREAQQKEQFLSPPPVDNGVLGQMQDVPFSLMIAPLAAIGMGVVGQITNLFS